jgi:transcription-repair coupling factor (superfamily II helicase)
VPRFGIRPPFDPADSRIVVPPGAVAMAVAELLHDGPSLIVTAGTRDAERLYDELRFWAPGVDVVMIPAWETLPHERLDPAADTVGTRLKVIRDLRAGRPPRAVVAPVRALQQSVPAEAVAAEPVVLGAGIEIDTAAVAARLIRFGYQRCDLVERRGQFALRGGILDVFPPTAPHPVRAELWGDTIDELREFAVADQRTIRALDHNVELFPVRELLIDDDVRNRAAKQAAAHPESRTDLLQLAEGIAVPGMEALAPLVSAGMVALADMLPDGASTIIIDPQRVAARAAETIATAQEFAGAAWTAAGMGGSAPMSAVAGVLADWDELRTGLPDLRTVTTLRSADDPDPALAPVGPYSGSAEALDDLAARFREGWQLAVVCAGRGPLDRLAEVLGDRDVPSTSGAEVRAGAVLLTVGALDAGFSWPAAKVAVFSDRDLARRTGDRRREAAGRLPARRRRQVDPLSLRPGDYIVHDKHGVGRFVELTRREARGADREFLVVEYAPGKRGYPPDRLFIPTDQLQAVSRYIGGEEPRVNKLGGSDWARAKGKARKAVKEIASELVRLYAARQAAPGFAFSPDSPWQRELEDAFEFVETADQLACIDEVKADMEKAVPMDRLICGDVGYGKTEIAVRAAFKAVQDGKQVAVLVPTTLLVRQHRQTFAERVSGFPVRVAALSRFQTAKESADVVRALAEGSVDIVIGTHRLLTPQVRFKDLGLVIVDEEQRFGVEHKEHLKALRANVDMLAMSATPIPRTLEMAVTGIREMSTIATPPEERLPVLTYVGPYDERQVAAAIHRELLRDGQIFFVHNRVDSIDRVAAGLSRLVPQARVAVAHGQMPEGHLERVVVDFWEGAVDVLVCTTIVESGIDIANANTLIVDRADAMGLSQLHQLRGRVGRSRSRAYAYFMHAPDIELSETAHERLATIAQNTDLGSGMQVALKDLEIRGAGNLLGGEQSGHIAEVGFDLYIRMVGEALAEFTGQEQATDTEVRIDLPVDAHIPPEYIAEERLRLEAYRRLAAAGDDGSVAELAAELVDRYGPVPRPVTDLIALARLRILAQRAGLDEVVAMGGRVRFHPVELPESRRVRLARLHRGSVVKPTTRQILVPLPLVQRQPITGSPVLDWAAQVIDTVILNTAPPPTKGAA